MDDVHDRDAGLNTRGHGDVEVLDAVRRAAARLHLGREGARVEDVAVGAERAREAVAGDAPAEARGGRAVLHRDDHGDVFRDRLAGLCKGAHGVGVSVS